MIYTGIGSRNTPAAILKKMKWYGHLLARHGFTLRSGGAEGADLAFEAGCDSDDGKKEIYLPWKGFNDNPSPLYNISQLSLDYAADVYGPSWQYLKEPSKLFMARNIHQVLGEELKAPSHFVICWTPDGCNTKKDRTKKTGGTGQAIACANELKLPIFNLQREGEPEKFMKHLNGIFK